MIASMTIWLLANHALLLQQLRRLGHVILERPETLSGAEGRNLVRGIQILQGISNGILHDLFPDTPGVAQWQILLQHLIVFFDKPCSELQI